MVQYAQSVLRRAGRSIPGQSSATWNRFPRRVPNDQVLDVGCGTGRGCATLGNAVGPDGRVIGVDIAEQMCQRSRKRLEDDRTSAVVRGHALTMPFDTDSFDAVLVSFTLELFENDHQRIVLDEIRRVLAPRGRLCVITPSTGASNLISLLYKRLNDVFPTLVDSRPLDVSAILAETGFETVQMRIEWAVIVPVEVVVARRRASTRDID